MKKTSDERILVARAMSCGPGLRLLRKKSKVSLRAVAEQVFVHYSHLSRVERGLAGASVATLDNLAIYYGFGHSVKRLLVRAELLQTRSKGKP